MQNTSRNNPNIKKALKAVGLISGGLDSALAAKIIQDLGIDVHGVFFDLPWRHKNIDAIQKLSHQLGITLKVEELGGDFLEIVKKPKYGRGTALNPCLDCHIYMIQKAGHYMDAIKADFIFTGEVLGQRPMSQHRASLELVEAQSGLKGRLLRPLSAGLLDPTDMENEGVIDRTKLLSLSGRGRKEQLKLARQYDLKYFAWPAGGCLLTDKHFSKRLEDLCLYGYRDRNDIILLKWARHFRINNSCKFIIGRDEKEDNLILEHAHDDDYILEFVDLPGPTLLLQGQNHDTQTLALAAGFLQYFSKYRNASPQKVSYRPKAQSCAAGLLEAHPVTEEQINTSWIW